MKYEIINCETLPFIIILMLYVDAVLFTTLATMPDFFIVM